MTEAEELDCRGKVAELINFSNEPVQRQSPCDISITQ